MVERAPEGTEPEVSLTVQEPKKVPATVGGAGEEESASDEPSEGGEPAAPATEAEPQQ